MSKRFRIYFCCVLVLSRYSSFYKRDIEAHLAIRVLLLDKFYNRPNKKLNVSKYMNLQIHENN